MKIKPTRGDTPNPSFRFVEWVFENGCKAHMIIDKKPFNGYHRCIWEISDDSAQWLYVTPDVFRAFLKLGNAEFDDNEIEKGSNCEYC